MKNRLTQFILVFLSLTLFTFCSEANTENRENVKNKASLEKVTKEISEPVIVPSVALSQDDSIVEEETVGIANIKKDVEADNSKVINTEKQTVKLNSTSSDLEVVETVTEKKSKVTPVEVLEERQEQESIAVSDHALWNSLLVKYVSKSGKVNYKGFKSDKVKLEEYLTQLKKTYPKSNWTKNEKLAYWINVYNAFTVQLIVENYPLKSITNLDKPWDKKFIDIDNNKYSLGDVENNILRKMGESRIHFAINCASVSCPKLLNEAFTAEKLSSQLRSVTKSFFADKTKNQLTEGNVKVSKLFEWYAADFSNGDIVAYINKYSGQTIATNSKVSFLEYNWNLNE